MNSSAPTATTMPGNRADANRRLRPSQRGPDACRIEGLRTLVGAVASGIVPPATLARPCAAASAAMLFAAILALAACTAPRTRAPVAQPPAKPPRSVPAAPVRIPAPAAAAAPASGIAVLDPRSYEQDKNRAKLALAKNSRDSLASSEVGYYMDVLQGRLKQVAGKLVGIGRKGDRIVLSLPGRSGFESGNTEINPGIREVLAPLSKVLVEYRMTLVSVRIRADDTGPQGINQRLAEQRALAVAGYLAEAGVSGKRIVIAGSGLKHPPAANTGPETRARIELQLEPIVRAASSER